MAKTRTPDDEMAKRLVQARIQRGLGDPKATATYFGWTYNTYIQHERGERGIRKDVAEKYAKALRVSAAWLLTGEGKASQTATSIEGQSIIVDRDLLRQAVQFVLQAEGVPAHRAALVADILPEALAGPAVDAVERDPFLSFRVHFQLEAQRSEPQEPR